MANEDGKAKKSKRAVNPARKPPAAKSSKQAAAEPKPPVQRRKRPSPAASAAEPKAKPKRRSPKPKAKPETPITDVADLPVATTADLAQAAEIQAKLAEGAGGRPTDYRPEFAAVARALCKRGATDYELAQEFGVTTSTIWRWTVAHEEFCSALKENKEAFDDRAERSLAQRAVGYTYNAQKVFQYQGQPIVVDYVEHVPPDPGAAKLWLSCRRPDKWRETANVNLDASDAFLSLFKIVAAGGVQLIGSEGG